MLAYLIKNDLFVSPGEPIPLIVGHNDRACRRLPSYQRPTVFVQEMVKDDVT